MVGMFLSLARQALSNPREAAETALSLGIPREALWPMFALMVILSVLLLHATALFDAGNAVPLLPPFSMLAISVVAGVVSVAAVWKIGSGMGGRGSFDEALLLTVFLQGILLVAQLGETIFASVLPPLSGVGQVALFVLAIWLNVNFIAVLHGFNSLWRALGVLVLASLITAAVLIVAMPLVGLSLTGAPDV